MERKELFNKTVGFLVSAYFDDTLIYCECAACAVGNIVAGNTGVKLKVKRDFFGCTDVYNDATGLHLSGFGGDILTNPGLWVNAIKTGTGRVLKRQVTPEILKQAELTGYSLQELADIEKAFYMGTKQNNDGNENNFEGLMKVCDCLMKIHDASEKEIKEAKSLFVTS